MPAPYEPTIGLEVHAELKTATKMFCGCLNDPDERQPNINICPVCMAHPGTLPVINQKAVRSILLIGTAVGGVLASVTEFDRKNYFYPDIPKNYQISQYEHPLVSGGSLDKIAITRVHLEEDTARSQHEGERSLIDFNRAGVPLMELVTDPVIHTAQEASSFARELQLLLRYLKVADANMEKGEMRVEANISVSKGDTLGTKVEIKNLNSFRSVEKAIAYEIKRQIAALESGERVMQETRGWDEKNERTFSQRVKESSHDYRYFPDPDLPTLVISEVSQFSAKELSHYLPELPWVRRTRYSTLGLKKSDADLFVQEPLFGDFFDAVVTHSSSVPVLLAASYLASDLVGKYKNGEAPEEWFNNKNAGRFSELMGMLTSGSLSSRGAKDVLAAMCDTQDTPQVLAEQKGLLQRSDPEFLDEIIGKVLEENIEVVAEYKAGKAASLQFLVGQGMKKSEGAANPEVLRSRIKESLSK